MQKLYHQREELVLSQLGLLQDLFHGTEVRLDLLLDVVVHDYLEFTLTLTIAKCFDLGEVYRTKGLSSDN